jgi:hypothetical protein
VVLDSAANAGNASTGSDIRNDVAAADAIAAARTAAAAEADDPAGSDPDDFYEVDASMRGLVQRNAHFGRVLLRQPAPTDESATATTATTATANTTTTALVPVLTPVSAAFSAQIAVGFADAQGQRATMEDALVIQCHFGGRADLVSVGAWFRTHLCCSRLCVMQPLRRICWRFSTGTAAPTPPTLRRLHCRDCWRELCVALRGVVALLCAHTRVSHITTHSAKLSTPTADHTDALVSALASVQSELLGMHSVDGGCTALVVLFAGARCYVANIGCVVTVYVR